MFRISLLHQFVLCVTTTTIVIAPSPVAMATDAPLHELVDRQIESGFQKWNVVPAEPCSDADFVRRIYLDLTGSIPNADAARAFITCQEPRAGTEDMTESV